jgi:TfoX/Sxy family transcriptional regulator of competence genes
MKFPDKSPETIEWFRGLAGQYAEIEFKPMFGHLAGFVNGQMTAGTFGDQIMMRLGEPDRTEFMNAYDAELFDPMGHRPMKEYVHVPDAVRADEPLMKSWLERSITYTASLPPKKKK